MFPSLLANKFRIFTDFPKFSCFSEATNNCSEAEWDLQMAFLQPPRECPVHADFQEALYRKPFKAPMQLYYSC
jgi:hypothetical protein